MRTLFKIFTNLIIWFWIVAIAVFSSQNIEGVSLKLFFLQSINFPVGILLAFCFGFGMILQIFLPFLVQVPQGRKKKQIKNKNKQKKVEYRETESSQKDWQDEGSQNW